MPYFAVENAMFYQKILSYLSTKFIDTVTLARNSKTVDGRKRDSSDGKIEIRSVCDPEFTSAGVHKVVVVIVVGFLGDEMVRNSDGIDVGCRGSVNG